LNLPRLAPDHQRFFCNLSSTQGIKPSPLAKKGVFLPVWLHRGPECCLQTGPSFFSLSSENFPVLSARTHVFPPPPICISPSRRLPFPFQDIVPSLRTIGLSSPAGLLMRFSPPTISPVERLRVAFSLVNSKVFSSFSGRHLHTFPLSVRNSLL